MRNNIDDTDHIKCPVEHPYFERSGFCWRPYWASRFESLWSLLRKFAHLNAINQYDVLRIFKITDVSQKVERQRWCLQADLRQFGALDQWKLSTMFVLDNRELTESTVLRFVQGREADILTSEFLRFCPTCIYQGFHSPIHQLLFLTNCPAHGDRLEVRCAECLTFPIPYKFPSITSNDLSNCIHFVHGLKQHLAYSNADELQKEAADREMALQPVAKLLMKRIGLNVEEQTISERILPWAKRRCVPYYLRRLFCYWAETFVDSSCKGDFKIPKNKSIHLQLRHRKTFHASVTVNRLDSKASLRRAAEAWDLELYRIYKAIGRHLIRSYLFDHHRCIARVDEDLEWSGATLTWQRRICPTAIAISIWRISLEVSAPEKLFQPSRRYRGVVYYPRVNWTSPSDDFSDWVLRRLFVLECIGLFHECFLLAEAVYRRNSCALDFRRYLKGRRRPHWLIEKRERDELILHWWVPRSLSSLFNRHSSSFRSCKAKS
jgi:hypothetical protein